MTKLIQGCCQSFLHHSIIFFSLYIRFLKHAAAEQRSTLCCGAIGRIGWCIFILGRSSVLVAKALILLVYLLLYIEQMKLSHLEVGPLFQYYIGKSSGAFSILSLSWLGYNNWLGLVPVHCEACIILRNSRVSCELLCDRWSCHFCLILSFNVLVGRGLKHFQ
jgi:hypothetical protein